MNTIVEIIEKIKAEVNRQKSYYYYINNSYNKKAIRVCNNLLSVLGYLEKEEKSKNSTDQEQPVKTNIVEDLKHYLSTTPKEQIKKDWESLKEWDKIGPSVSEFLGWNQPVCKGLEEEIKRFQKEIWDRDTTLSDVARHFALWQKEQDIRDMFMSDNRHFNKVYELGKKDMREQMMIQWTGNNLKDLIEFTGKSPRFNEWFKSWDDYEDYVRQHGNIFKMFNDDGSHLEVPVGAWIVKTPDKRCVASKFTLKQPESEKIAAAYQLGLADKEKQMMKEAVECYYGYVNNCTKVFLPEETLKGVKEGYVRIVILKNNE